MISGTTYFADYSLYDNEYNWWFWDSNDNEFTHEEYKQAIIEAAKTVEGTDFTYAYGYVDEITETGNVKLGYALVNNASTSGLISWSQQAIGTVIIASNNDFFITTNSTQSVNNEVHIKLSYCAISAYAPNNNNFANRWFCLYYPHVKGTECKIYDKHMKLLLTLENSACAYPITDPYTNEQTIVIEK